MIKTEQMKKTIENTLQFILTFVSLASAYYISILANDKNLDLGFLILILVATTVLVWFINYKINERILKINTENITLRYEFERKVEGLWIEKYNPEVNKSGYGLIEIIYDKESKSTYLKGSVYDAEGNSFANWASKSVYSDRNKKSLLYIYDGEFTNSRLDGNGYGKIDFSNSNAEILISATGCFEDHTMGFKPVSFEIDRLNDEICNNIIGKKNPEFSYDRQNLVIGYHAYITSKKSSSNELSKTAAQMPPHTG